MINFQKCSAVPMPLYINGDCVERVPVFRFLGTYISVDLSWAINTTTVVKKSQQRLYFLRILRQNHLQQKLLVSYYHCSIKSVLMYCISVWYASCSVADRRALQKVINTAQKIIGCPLLSLKDLFSSCCLSRSVEILKDPFHPGHHLFDLLPSGRCFRSIVSWKIDSRTVSTPEPYENRTQSNTDTDFWTCMTVSTTILVVTFTDHCIDVTF